MRAFAFAALLVFFACAAQAQMNVQEYALPPRITAHDVWADPAPDGPVWFSGQSGIYGRLDPKTGAWKAWKAPGERPRVYAVYVDETDKVWISEWDKQLMMRFDPATEKWDSYSSSSGSANVRQIHGRKAEVWTPESASGELVVYRYR